ncbi:TetR/AcrR family transcriptional regulator [Prosthecomicrobium sp. N25]|uniref:TetR/AcrR family transcriptional regulator n=1 Tax=Prosthecomicrobium sp. N25 TaxID=3129254 RepID=UPI0030785A10
MPRRMEKSHDDLRRDAVAAARAVVDAHGVGGLTVRRVSEAIGCSVGTIYNLFADLDDLIVHVASGILDDMHEALFGPPGPADPVERLRDLAQRYLAFAVANPRLWSMLFEYSTADDRPLPDWHVARIDRLVRAVQETAAAAIPGGPEDVKASVDVLWASVHGIAALALRGKLGIVTADSAGSLADRLVVTFLAGARQAAGARVP